MQVNPKSPIANFIIRTKVEIIIGMNYGEIKAIIFMIVLRFIIMDVHAANYLNR